MSKHWRILGSVLLVGLVAWRVDWRQLGHAFAQLDVRLWLWAVLLYVLAQLISSLRWLLLSRPLGFQVSYFRHVSLYFIGMFFNLVLPTSVGGDVVRAWYLSAQGMAGAGPPGRAAAFLSVLAERGSGLIVLVLLACLAALVVPVPLPGWMSLVLLALAGGFLLGLLSLPFLHLLERLPLVGRKLRPFVLAARTYRGRPGLLFVAGLLSVLVQIGGVIQVWLVSIGLGLDVPVSYLAVAVPLVTLLTLLPISVNGMGLRELGLVVLLGPVGVTSEAAVALSLMQFAVTVTTSLAGAGFYLIGPYPRFSKAQVGGGQSDADVIGGDPHQGREGQSATAA